MFLRTAFVATAFALAAPVFAAPEDDLIEALGVPQMVQIMREEGQGYGADLGRDMLPGGSDAAWEAVVDRIYDTDAMLETVRAGFAEEIEGTDLDPLLDYFTSDAGARIVGLEISAREAMVSEDVEEAARDAYRMAAAEEDPSLEPLEALIEANDLVEANVVGALNASFQFYAGLVDGGALEMTEREILDEVWEAGGWLLITGDQVRAVPRDAGAPSDRLTPELLARVDTYQAELLRALTRVPKSVQT